MEAIGMGLQAIGKAKMDEMKDWFNFFKKKDRF